MSEIAELARGQWHYLLTKAGIDEKFLKKKGGPCPICGGRDRFMFDDKGGAGTWHCRGCEQEAGDGFALLMNYLGYRDFKEAVAFVKEALGGGQTDYRPSSYQPAAQDEEAPEKTRERLNRAWSRSVHVKIGDPVWQYITNTRQLAVPLESPIWNVLRYSAKGQYYEEDDKGKYNLVGTFPMMIAKVVDLQGKPVGIHRTYLTHEGIKAPVGDAKKLMKGLGYSGAAIRLLPADGSVLAVCEGIETAIAVHLITGQPVWACIASKILAKLEVPDHVRTVFIYGDNDEPDERGRRAGQEAVADLAARLQAQGKVVKIVMPSKAGTDFHDIWIARCKTRAAKAERKAQAAQLAKQAPKGARNAA